MRFGTRLELPRRVKLYRQADPELVYQYTNKWNTAAVISDGTRVLGLGDIGPKAGLPVIEGKALLYKYLGGVDGVAITLDTKDPDAIISTVRILQPAFGGINLEDISQPKCFRILDTLRARTITDEMCIAAAEALAKMAEEKGLNPDYILREGQQPGCTEECLGLLYRSSNSGDHSPIDHGGEEILLERQRIPPVFDLLLQANDVSKR